MIRTIEQFKKDRGQIRFDDVCDTIAELTAKLDAARKVGNPMRETAERLADRIMAATGRRIATIHGLASLIRARDRETAEDTWAHVFQGIDEPCGCENHRRLLAILDAPTKPKEARNE